MNILVHPLAAVGHVNACIGLSQSLAARGHRIHFLVSRHFADTITAYGFNVIELASGSSAESKTSTSAGEMTQKVMKEAKQFDNHGPAEKMKHLRYLFEKMYEGISKASYNEQVAEVVRTIAPDLIVLDQYLFPPALVVSGVPLVFLFSGNPLRIYRSKLLPPPGFGLSINSDRGEWQKYEAISMKLESHLERYQAKLLEGISLAKPFSRYDHLNIYGFPRELDYDDVVVPRPSHLLQVDTFCRLEPAKTDFCLPKDFLDRPEGCGLIYLSLGSIGYSNQHIMGRLINVLARTKHRTIVSKGSVDYQLPANIYGEAYLPQTIILSHVDLVLTHGGNNTITETFAAGKKMIVFPMFSDQFDNATRISDKGFGRKMNPFEFTDDELLEAIEQLLGDEQLQRRLDEATERIVKDMTRDKACSVLENYAKTV